MGKSLGSSGWTLKNDEIYVVWKHQAKISPWNWDGNIGGIEILKFAFSNLEGSQHVGKRTRSVKISSRSSHGTFIDDFLSSNHLSDLSDLWDNIRYQTQIPQKFPKIQTVVLPSHCSLCSLACGVSSVSMAIGSSQWKTKLRFLGAWCWGTRFRQEVHPCGNLSRLTHIHTRTTWVDKHTFLYHFQDTHHITR